MELFERVWKISRRAPACAACSRDLAAEAAAYASLHEGPVDGGGFLRLDRCPACWEGATDRGFSFWSYRPAPPPARAPRADLASMREVYLRLAGRETVGDRLTRYLLGLYLVRKKKLWLARSERTSGGEVLWIRSEREGSPEPVPVPAFSPEEMEEARLKLDALLGLGKHPVTVQGFHHGDAEITEQEPQRSQRTQRFFYEKDTGMPRPEGRG